MPRYRTGLGSLPVGAPGAKPELTADSMLSFLDSMSDSPGQKAKVKKNMSLDVDALFSKGKAQARVFIIQNLPAYVAERRAQKIANGETLDEKDAALDVAAFFVSAASVQMTAAAGSFAATAPLFIVASVLVALDAAQNLIRGTGGYLAIRFKWVDRVMPEVDALRRAEIETAGLLAGALEIPFESIGPVVRQFNARMQPDVIQADLDRVSEWREEVYRDTAPAYIRIEPPPGPPLMETGLIPADFMVMHPELRLGLDGAAFSDEFAKVWAAKSVEQFRADIQAVFKQVGSPSQVGKGAILLVLGAGAWVLSQAE